MPTGNWTENLKEAIVCYKNALRVRTEAEFPADWARTQSNLGSAYALLPVEEDRTENLKKAIDCYRDALRVRTETAFPADWATTQTSLGLAYARFPTEDRILNLKKAISCYEDALRVRTEAEFPGLWAKTQRHLGEALEALSALTSERSLFLRAIACFEAAMRGYAACGLADKAEGMRKRADAARKNL